MKRFRFYERYQVGIYMLSLILFIIALNIAPDYIGKGKPSLSDYQEISLIQMKKLIDKKDVSQIYYTKNELYVYAVTNEKEYKKTSNPDTDAFKDYLYDSDIIINRVTEMDTKDKDLSDFHVFAGIVLFVYTAMLIFMLLRKYTINIGKAEALEGNLKRPISSFDNRQDKESFKTFSDIAGLYEVKKDMRCLVDFLIHKEKYEEMGASLPKGVILYGPPGTGKTLLAKAIAGEADVPFYYMSGSDFVEKYVGVGAQRVRELFHKARKNAPAIIFIDEIDTIGGNRSDYQNSEDRKTINALLTEMDGFNEMDNIIVIGATNHLEELDEALMRPGRFTDKFCVPLPETVKERKEILQMYAKNKKLGSDIDLDILAKELIGFSPAKIEALLNEAAIIAVQKEKRFIEKEDIDSALYKVLLNGHEREDRSERDKEEVSVVAWHEAGHALIGKLFGKDVTKVTIVSSTSGAGGVTFTTPKRGGLYSLMDLKQEVCELYGGRMAEYLYFKEDKEKITTGASNDIERATAIINDMVDKYGMTDSFGLLNMNKIDVDKEKALKAKIQLSEELQEKTLTLLKQHQKTLKKIADILLDKETITGEDLDVIMAS